MAHELTTSYLRDSLSLLRYYKKLAERAMEQVTDEQLTAALDGEMNCIAIIVKHLVGNMRSRWTDFLTSDGEKSDRKRDTEFENPPATRAALMALWEEGWNRVFAALEPLSDADVERTVDDPRGAALGHASDQSSDHPLCLSLRTDRVSGEASAIDAMEGAHGSAGQVGGVQPESGGQGSQPALGKGGLRASGVRLGPGFATIPAVSGGRPRPPRRGRDALGTAGKMPALLFGSRAVIRLAAAVSSRGERMRASGLLQRVAR